MKTLLLYRLSIIARILGALSAVAAVAGAVIMLCWLCNAYGQVRVDTVWRPLPKETVLTDCTTTYPGDTILIYRENEIGMYTLDTVLCALKIIQRDNHFTDILTCDKNLFRLQPKQFFRRK